MEIPGVSVPHLKYMSFSCVMNGIFFSIVLVLISCSIQLVCAMQSLPC